MSTVESPTPAPAPAPEPRTCPRCGAPLIPGQEWCLSCGADTRSQIAGTPRWRGPIAIAAVLGTLIVAGLVLAFLELSDGGEPVARAPTPSPAPVEPGPGASGSPAPSPTPSPGAEVSPTPSPGAEETPTPSPGAEETPTPGATATPDSSSQVGEWPEGETAYTVIVRSSKSRSAAESTAEDLASQGKDAGVLRSDDFSSLNAGYWVAFVGQYDSASQARSEAESIGGGAYARRVVPG
jgi:hypothetical protein